MRRQTPTSSILYTYLFPRPSQNDPQNFSTHLARHLIPEIRVETARFYGGLDTIEARYPGLNYTHPPHIMRLSKFPHHARLFEAVRTLGISDGELLDLVRWEGTLWARERFERDEGYEVKDTTGDGIAEWIDPRHSKIPIKPKVRVNTLVGVDVREVPASSPLATDGWARVHSDVGEIDDEGAESDEDGSVGEAIESIGLDLNRRLLQAVAARQQGENVEMDPEFEAYLKEQIESGFINPNAFTSSNNRGRNLITAINAVSGYLVSQPRPASNTTISQPAA